MERKQILRVNQAHNDLIVMMNYSQVNYVDDVYFREKFEEI